MDHYFMKIILTTAILVSSICPPSLAVINEVQTMPNVKAGMLQADYWINKIPDPDRVILDTAAIDEFNREIIKKVPNCVYNLINYPDSLTREQLTKLIDYPLPTNPSYIGAEVVSDAYWQQLEQQMNIKGIPENNPVQYGLSVKRGNLKYLPTVDVIGDEPNDPAFDLFQNSSILPAEPVIILHHSLDGQWYFVQMYNCRGWLPAADIAVCDRNIWMDYQQEQDFLMINANRIKLDSDPLLPEFSEMEFTMGTKLPLVKSVDLPDSIRSRRLYGNYVVKLPARNLSGQLEFVMVPIPISNDVTVGYLPYTRANIIRQAFKMQGNRYGWGGMLNGRDCSSLVMELNRCFGFKLARNTDEQVISAGKTISFDGRSTAEREKLLQRLSPGATLFFPGHEMLYLGEDSGRYYVFSALGSYGLLQPGQTKLETVRVRTVVINELNITRASGVRWIEALTAAKLLE